VPPPLPQKRAGEGLVERLATGHRAPAAGGHALLPASELACESCGTRRRWVSTRSGGRRSIQETSPEGPVFVRGRRKQNTASPESGRFQQAREVRLAPAGIHPRRKSCFHFPRPSIPPRSQPLRAAALRSSQSGQGMMAMRGKMADRPGNAPRKAREEAGLDGRVHKRFLTK